MNDKKHVSLDKVGQTFSHALLLSVVFWIAVLLANYEPEIGTLFTNGGKPFAGSVVGVFCAFFVVSYLLRFVLHWIETDHIQWTDVSDIFRQVFGESLILTTSLVGGFVHGSETLYYQYSAIEFIPIQFAIFITMWIMIVSINVVVLALSFPVRKAKTNQSSDQSLIWSLPEDKAQ